MRQILEISRKKKKLFSEEHYKKLAGFLVWQVQELVSMSVNWALKSKQQTTNLYAINKVLKFIITNESHIIIPSLDLNSIQIHLDLDTSFNVLPDGGS